MLANSFGLPLFHRGKLTSAGFILRDIIRANWLSKNCKTYRFRRLCLDGIIERKREFKELGKQIAGALKTNNWPQHTPDRVARLFALRYCDNCGRLYAGQCNCKGFKGICTSCKIETSVAPEYDRADQLIGTTCRMCRRSREFYNSAFWFWPKPSNKFAHNSHISTKIDDAPLTIGFELEALFAGPEAPICAETHQGDRGHLHCKHDGSMLANYRGGKPARSGLEFCSGFGSFDAIRTVLERAIGIIRKFGGFCAESCGLHVAIGGLLPLQTMRMIYFWNCDENKIGLYRFARRLPNNYCRAKKIDRIDTYFLTQDHYDLVCVHDSYSEFRGFSGSLTLPLNLARISFLLELAEYCKDHRVPNDLTFPCFENFLSKRKTEHSDRVRKRLRRPIPAPELQLVESTNWHNF